MNWNKVKTSHYKKIPIKERLRIEEEIEFSEKIKKEAIDKYSIKVSGFLCPMIYDFYLVNLSGYYQVYGIEYQKPIKIKEFLTKQEAEKYFTPNNMRDLAMNIHFNRFKFE